jgi:hypothetical protein
MTVIAQDPTIRTGPRGRRILMAKAAVPAEDLIPGPAGYRVQVVDYDASTGRFLGTHRLPPAYENEPRRWQHGDPAIVKDLAFHAQNVYALIMKTLARFEFALGRRIGWSFGTHQIKVAPHGMQDANAFYAPREEGLVFGYFEGLDGGTVYACLSHDVIVHETTHALIDALRERYMDPSSPDQGAFHEGLADVIALLSVFSQPELLRQMLCPPGKEQRPPVLIRRRDVTAEALREGPVFRLARQMGEEMEGARGSALRHSVTITPDPRLLKEPDYQESHRRGEIFVAAVMNAFIAAWARRIEESGTPDQQDYPIKRVAEEGADIADAMATMWIRALDYMPPVHLEFGDALSAALTADYEVRPDDTRFALRRHVMGSFRSYGIAPRGKGGDAPGTWRRPDRPLRYDRVRFESMRSDEDEVFRFLWENRQELDLELGKGAYTEVLSVRPCIRVGVDGFTLRETVAEYYQVARLAPDELQRESITVPPDLVTALAAAARAAASRQAGLPEAAEADGEDADPGAESVTPIYGGGVLIFDEYGRLKYHVHNSLFNGPRQTARLKYLWNAGFLQADSERAQLKMDQLSRIHRMRAIDARRPPAQVW